MVLLIGFIILFSITQNSNIIFGHTIGTGIACDNEGEQVSVSHISRIKCYNCICKNEFVLCTKRKCYAENCKIGPRDECCPNCKDDEKLTNPVVSNCVFGNRIYTPGLQFNLDDCTVCICLNSTTYCEKKKCPILECNWKNQIVLPGQCCPQCRAASNSNKGYDSLENDEKDDEILVQPVENNAKKDKVQKEINCAYGDEIHKNGDTWNLTQCLTCTCTQGKINCSKMMCPALICPSNSVLKIPEGHCCPICMQSGGVCTIFGGSHYRTFDGKMFSFIGSCKYQLVSDCDSESFHIQLETLALGNDVVIKRVSFKSGDLNVDLLKNRNIKFDKEVIDLPFRLRNELEVRESSENVIISWKNKITILWNYLDFVEITVSKSYRKKLCGLCGNFNSIAEDDFTTHEGIMVQDPSILAQSWTSGDEVCFDIKNHGIRGCDPRKHQRLCSYLKGSVFEKCLKKLNVTSYYELCLKDMCECAPDDLQCHCTSFSDYVRDCRILGVRLSRWRNSVGC